MTDELTYLREKMTDELYDRFEYIANTNFCILADPHVSNTTFFTAENVYIMSIENKHLYNIWRRNRTAMEKALD
jgi:hypothetical protein